MFETEVSKEVLRIDVRYCFDIVCRVLFTTSCLDQLAAWIMISKVLSLKSIIVLMICCFLLWYGSVGKYFSEARLSEVGFDVVLWAVINPPVCSQFLNSAIAPDLIIVRRLVLGLYFIIEEILCSRLRSVSFRIVGMKSSVALTLAVEVDVPWFRQSSAVLSISWKQSNTIEASKIIAASAPLHSLSGKQYHHSWHPKRRPVCSNQLSSIEGWEFYSTFLGSASDLHNTHSYGQSVSNPKEDSCSVMNA